MTPIGDDDDGYSRAYFDRVCDQYEAQLIAMQNCYNCTHCIEDCAPPCQGKCPKWAWEGAKKEVEQP